MAGTPATPLQRALLADHDLSSEPGHQSEQLAFDWYGPLEPAVFTAAWQAVFAAEAVLRSCFDDGPNPRILVLATVEPDITVRQVPDDARPGSRRPARGVDPRRPGPLRITVLRHRTGARILLTFHRALLDARGVRLLLRSFARAYRAGGRLPGGERRPDLRDYADWLTTRHPDEGLLDAPRVFAGAGGAGHHRLRLTTAGTRALRTTAGRWGCTESTLVQAVWALLLHHDTGTDQPVPVRFAAAVPGRTVALDGTGGLPGALRTVLPVTVLVDPRETLVALTAALRDTAVDHFVRTGTPPGRALDDTLVSFENPLREHTATARELAAAGVRVTLPESLGADTTHPVTLRAHHDEAGRLVLTLSHRCALDGAATVLARAELLLRALSGTRPPVTVAEALALLPAPAGVGVLRPLRPEPAPRAAPVLLRPASRPEPLPRPGPAGGHPLPPDVSAVPTVALLAAPGVDRSYYTRLARAYRGPERLVLLPARHRLPEGDLRALGALCGQAGAACRLAHRAEGPPPSVVVAAPATGATDFAAALAAAAADTRAAASH
ncbi:condensation domain-containing protein [Streptomyces griseofuscus]|uniref:condensation domain-containing protein n=1 Tax=Streptomyces griseofuscus TaxID=146922 RepID=UPI00368B3C58